MTSSTLSPPSGRQHSISAGDYRATVVEVGGGLRECYRGRRPVIQSYSTGAMCDGAHGAALIPWPNRLADGQYTFQGRHFQVPLTEPDKHNGPFNPGCGNRVSPRRPRPDSADDHHQCRRE
jgi:aldose 1-epimerase